MSCTDLQMPGTPVLSFYAATQVPGLALPLTALEYLPDASFVSVTSSGLLPASFAAPVRPAHAFVRNAAIYGTFVYVQLDGLLNGFSGLAAGFPYFLGGSGAASLTSPSSGITQQIGVAVSTDTMLVQLQPPIYLT